MTKHSPNSISSSLLWASNLDLLLLFPDIRTLHHKLWSW